MMFEQLLNKSKENITELKRVYAINDAIDAFNDAIDTIDAFV